MKEMDISRTITNLGSTNNTLRPVRNMLSLNKEIGLILNNTADVVHSGGRKTTICTKDGVKISFHLKTDCFL